jgi:glycosyltransferase involved in cell wall biosynthesis
MRVAWVCEYPASAFPERAALARIPPGHPVPWVVVQAPLVAASGVELHIVTVSKHLDADEEFTSGGVHFHFLKIPRLPRASMAYQVDRMRMARCLHRIRPALVHGFGTEASFGYTAVSGRFPSVLMIQGIISRIARVRGRAALLRQPGVCVSLLVERVTIRRARHVVCETAFAAEFVRQHNPAAVVHRISTPIRDEWFQIARRAGDPGVPEVLFVGWVLPEKGIEVLLHAFSRIVQEHPGSVLHVVGACNRGYLEGVLTPLVSTLRLEDRVVFHGQQSAALVADRLSRASVLALPTLMDTAPNVLAEARAAGVPVVASAAGGIPELIEDRIDGVLVPPGSADRLAAAIGSLLGDPGRAAAIGERGRERARRDHRAPVQVAKLLDVYRDVLAKPPALA